jgi:hypothetical protein
MDYIPVQPKPVAETKPEYTLVEDVTKQAPPRRGIQVLSDGKGKQLRAPYPPKVNCKKCYGRGYIGIDTSTGELMPCRKCYPFNK